MAPEMIKNHPHDHRLDIWCLGVLLYEMLHGYAPFKGKNDQEKCANIVRNNQLIFDSSISSEACDVVRKILKPAPVDRISMDQIFKHTWMRKYEKYYKIDILSYIAPIEEEETPLPNKGSLTSNGNVSTQAGSLGNGNGNSNSSNAKIITIVDDTLSYKYNEKNHYDPYNSKQIPSSYMTSSLENNNNNKSIIFLSSFFFKNLNKDPQIEPKLNKYKYQDPNTIPYSKNDDYSNNKKAVGIGAGNRQQPYGQNYGGLLISIYLTIKLNLIGYYDKYGNLVYKDDAKRQFSFGENSTIETQTSLKQNDPYMSQCKKGYFFENLYILIDKNEDEKLLKRSKSKSINFNHL